MDFEFEKRLVWLNGVLPGALLTYDWAYQGLGANPPEAVIRTTGVIAIIFLVLTLTVTPLSRLLQRPSLGRHRRWMGLFCFYYALVHLLSYVVFDKEFIVYDILGDIRERPFILLGFAGFLLLLPLALTSSNAMIRKMGPVRWKGLHKLTYLIPPLVVAHFWLIVKSDLFYPLLFAVIFLCLYAARLQGVFKKPVKRSGPIS